MSQTQKSIVARNIYRATQVWQNFLSLKLYLLPMLTPVHPKTRGFRRSFSSVMEPPRDSVLLPVPAWESVKGCNLRCNGFTSMVPGSPQLLYPYDHICSIVVDWMCWMDRHRNRDPTWYKICFQRADRKFLWRTNIYTTGCIESWCELLFHIQKIADTKG
jgi:hypothetical protein